MCVVSFSASQLVEVSGVCGEFQCQSVGLASGVWSVVAQLLLVIKS